MEGSDPPFFSLIFHYTKDAWYKPIKFLKIEKGLNIENLINIVKYKMLVPIANVLLRFLQANRKI